MAREPVARTERRATSKKKKTKKTKKKPTPRSSARKKPPRPKASVAAPSPFVRLDVLVEPRHLQLLNDLARRFGCVSPRGDPSLADVVRVILDRYGDNMLRLAQPRPARAHDEEE